MSIIKSIRYDMSTATLFAHFVLAMFLFIGILIMPARASMLVLLVLSGILLAWASYRVFNHWIDLG